MNDLNKHKKSDKTKWILTGVAFVLIFVFLVGLCMQLFAKDDKYKPSEWFRKPETEQTQPNNNETPEAAAVSSIAPRLMAKTMSATVDSDNGVSAQSNVVIDSISQYMVTYTVDFEFNCKVVNNVYPWDYRGTSGLFWKCRKDEAGNIGLIIDKNKAQSFFSSIDSNEYTLSGISLSQVGSSDDFATFTEIEGDNYFLHIPIGWTFEKSICLNFTAKTPPREPIPLPENPVKEGYTFVGWYYDRNFEIPYDGEPIYSDTELFAKFEINEFTVTFNSNGGSTVYNQIVEWNTAATLTTPTREKYAFKGWFLADGTQYTNQPIKENTTLTAHWERNVFTVAFNTDGGAAVSSQDVVLNSSVTLPTTTKTGYVFNGWFMADGTEYTNQPITTDITLTAHWVVQTFTVTFYVDGEIFTTKTVEYGQGLVAVAETANLKMLSVRMASGAPVYDDNGVMLVTENCSVEAQEMDGTDKVINTVKNNKWQIIGGVAGGVALIAVIAALCSGIKRKKR